LQRKKAHKVNSRVYVTEQERKSYNESKNLSYRSSADINLQSMQDKAFGLNSRKNSSQTMDKHIKGQNPNGENDNESNEAAKAYGLLE